MCTFAQPARSAPIHRGDLDDTGRRLNKRGHYEQLVTFWANVYEQIVVPLASRIQETS